MKRLIPSLILLVLLLGAVFIGQMMLNKPNIPQLYTIPAFEYPSNHGSAFTNNNFINKISVANFIFTKCPGICPVMSREMSVLYEEFSGSEQIQFVSFSVDPSNDSLQALKDYAGNWGVHDQRWHFLRTDKESIQTLYEDGFKLGGELPYGHSIKFVLIDNNNTIRGYFTYDDPDQMEQLKKQIEILAEEI
jgi:protein SCO1/2